MKPNKLEQNQAKESRIPILLTAPFTVNTVEIGSCTVPAVPDARVAVKNTAIREPRCPICELKMGWCICWGF